MSDIVKVDETYKKWIKNVSVRFKNSQIKAAIKVNEEMLRFYWTLGKRNGGNQGNCELGKSFLSTGEQGLDRSITGSKIFFTKKSIIHESIL